MSAPQQPSHSPRPEDFPKPSGNPFRRRKLQLQQQRAGATSSQQKQTSSTSFAAIPTSAPNNHRPSPLHNNKQPTGSLSSDTPEVCAPLEPARTPRYVRGGLFRGSSATAESCFCFALTDVLRGGNSVPLRAPQQTGSATASRRTKSRNIGTLHRRAKLGSPFRGDSLRRIG